MAGKFSHSVVSSTEMNLVLLDLKFMFSNGKPSYTYLEDKSEAIHNLTWPKAKSASDFTTW